MGVYDVLIIGGGIAGLSAATVLVRQMHSIVVFDSGNYRNGPSKHMHNVATWDHKDPAEYRATAKRDLLERYSDITFENAEVTSIREVDGAFEVTTAKGTWQGKKVILAAGVTDKFPDIDGYAECWGKGVYHCLFCHGYEDRHLGSAGVLGVGVCANPPHALQMARNASQLCGKATIFSNGADDVKDAIVKAVGDSDRISVDGRPIKRLALAEKGGVNVEFTDGSSQHVAFLAHAPTTSPSGPFVEQLGLEVQGPFSDIKVSPPFSQTSKRGVFAGGDNMVPGKAAPIAMSNGTLAALGASTQLQTELHGHPSMF